MANIKSTKAKAPKGVSTKKVRTIRNSSKGVSSSNNDISKQVILTRSGRIRKKSEKRLKVLEPILKNELQIKGKRKMNDNIVSNGEKKIKNNNNDSAVSDQNIEFEKVDINGSEVTEENRNGITAKNGKVQKVSIAAEDNSTKNVMKPKNKKQQENKKSKEILTMDKELRNNVINQMKNALSPGDDEEEIPEVNPKKYRRQRAKRDSVIEKDTESDTPDEDEVPKKQKKPTKKQVTLSNGLVLTLSMYTCVLCDKTFSTKTSLTRHKLTHEDQPNHNCEHCKKKFRNENTLKRHLQKSHPELHPQPEYHICGICDKVFLMKENLELHLGSHVKAEKYRCVYCFKTFSYQMLLDQHEKCHHSEVDSVYKCFLCEMEFANRYRLQMHMKTHTKTKEYICHQCGKGFLRFNSIKRHVLVCHSGHRIQCPICFKELTGHLAEHMRVHEDNRPYKCPDCGMAFKQSTQLNVHRRCHSGVRPYTCKICERPFSHSNALMLHIRRHTGEKPFTCAMCPISFSQLPHMKTHMLKIHGKDSAYKCQKCKHFFKLKAQLEDHSKICTVGDKEVALKEKIPTSEQAEEIEVESVMTISRMRYLLALLLTMIATKTKLKYLGENILLIVY